MLDNLAHSATSNSVEMERPLSEQLQINEQEIENRKGLLGFTKEDEQNLAALQLVIVDHVDRIIDEYYEQLLRSQEVRHLIDNAETLQRVCEAMRCYVIELFGGDYDSEYVNKRLRIGKVHHHIGLPPKLYVSAVVLLQKLITDVILKNVPENGNHDDLRSALTKLFMFDMQLVFDAYISSLVAEEYSALVELTEYSEKLEKSVAGKAERLREVSTRDSMTGLYNMRGFSENLRRELSLADRITEPLTLVYFDLNGLTKLNGTKGRDEGDRILCLAGSAILSSVRDVDYACRYGSDEFCIILPRTNMAMAQEVYNRVIQTFDKGETLGVTFSAGISQTGPDSFLPMSELVKDVINWMHKAKAQSKINPGHNTQPNAEKVEAN